MAKIVDKSSKLLRKYVCSECGAELDHLGIETCPKCNAVFEESIRRRKEESSKKVEKGIGGWLAFFIFTLAISIPLNLFFGVLGVLADLSDPTFSFPSNLIFIFLDVVLVVGVIGFLFYSIYSLYKIKSNAVSVAKMALGILFFSNCFPLIVSLIVGDYLDVASSIRWLIYPIIWFLYLTNSKRIEATYPTKERATYKRDIILFLIVIATMPLALLVGIIVG